MIVSRISCSLAAFFLLLSYFPPCELGAQEKIRLAHSALESSNSVWYLAKERGLYKKYGLDADLLFIPSTTTSVSSLVAGDVQVANASGASDVAARALIRGLGYRGDAILQDAQGRKQENHRQIQQNSR